MKEISLLDCTLRDGGYVNDWEFGHNNLISMYERIVESGIDIIEVGFVDERRPFDINKSIFPKTEYAGKIWGSISRKAPMTVGMIDYGTCGIENLQPASESFLDGIRVIFKKHIMHEAMEFCLKVKSLGYKVFSQLVSITSYSDEELMELIDLVNKVKPYAVSMVDTYGLLHPKDLLHYFSILDEHVDLDIKIGFHAHNNFQLAYANAITFVDYDSRHDIVVDGTLYGMGKSAGNAADELVSMYLNNNYGKEYKINEMLEAIEESVLEFYRRTPWNYKPFFYLSARNKCHPNYVSYYLKKENLSISKLNDILFMIEPEEKKLMFDPDVAEDLYNEFVAENIDDVSEYNILSQIFKDRKILIIGPGKNIQLQKDLVKKYICNNSPAVISINYLPQDFDVDYVFITNKYRYQQMTDSLCEIKNQNVKMIATSNVECRNGQFAYKLDRLPLLEKDEDIIDNSFLMLLKVLKKVGVRHIACAGLDGYTEKENNYFNPIMEYPHIRSNARNINKHIKSVIDDTRKYITIEFVTYSHYEEVEDINGASI